MLLDKQPLVMPSGLMHPLGSARVKAQQVHHARTCDPPATANGTRTAYADLGNTGDLPCGAGGREQDLLRAILRVCNGFTSS